MGEQAEAASDVNKRITSTLVECGERAGFAVVSEYAVSGGRIDVVWLWQPEEPIPGLEAAVPVVGFEVESSWRTRKHIKGDMVNLLDAGCALGVIVCAGDTPEDEALRRFARTLVDRPGPTILIWTARDVEGLHLGQASPLVVPQGPETVDDLQSAASRPVGEHTGKYAPLWRWLRSQDQANFTATFAEIEDAISMPLPPSCRRHVAHWYSYEGSAVARAIADSGWRASGVQLSEQTVVLSRGAS